VKRSKLELACQIREPHAWTRRTGLKVPSGLGAFLQTTREGDKGRFEKAQRGEGRRGEREKGRKGEGEKTGFSIFYFLFVIFYFDRRVSTNA